MKKFLSLVLAAMMLVCMMPTVSADDGEESIIRVGVVIDGGDPLVIAVNEAGELIDDSKAGDYLSYDEETHTVEVAKLPNNQEVYIFAEPSENDGEIPTTPIKIYFDDVTINGKLIIAEVTASLSGKLTVKEAHENFAATEDPYYDSAAACFEDSTVTFCEGSSFTFIDDSNPVDDSFKVNMAVYLDNSAFICDGANMVVVATDERGNIDFNAAIYSATLYDNNSIHVKSGKMTASANNGKDTNVAIGVMSVTVTGGKLTATTKTDEDTDADDDANNIGIYCGSLTLDESGFLEVCGFNGGDGVFCMGNITLDEYASLNAVVYGDGRAGVYCGELVLQKNASLTATATGMSGYGVFCGDLSLLEKAQLKATASGSWGIGVVCDSLTLGAGVGLEAEGDGAALDVEGAINIPDGKELQFSDDNKYLNFTSSASEEKDGGFTASPIMFMLIYKMRMSHNYAIETEASEGGRIVIEGDSSYRYNEDALYKIVPDEGYEIVSVIIDGVDMGAITEYEFINIRENHTVSAVFAEIAE